MNIEQVLLLDPLPLLVYTPEFLNFQYVCIVDPRSLYVYRYSMCNLCLSLVVNLREPRLKPSETLARVPSTYMRQMSEKLLIPHNQLQLMDCIGQGKDEGNTHM